MICPAGALSEQPCAAPCVGARIGLLLGIPLLLRGTVSSRTSTPAPSGSAASGRDALARHPPPRHQQATRAGRCFHTPRGGSQRVHSCIRLGTELAGQRWSRLLPLVARGRGLSARARCGSSGPSQGHRKTQLLHPRNATPLLLLDGVLALRSRLHNRAVRHQQSRPLLRSTAAELPEL